MPLHNKRVEELTQLTNSIDILQLLALHTPDDMDWCKARTTVDECMLVKPLTTDFAARKWTLNLV